MVRPARVLHRNLPSLLDFQQLGIACSCRGMIAFSACMSRQSALSDQKCLVWSGRVEPLLTNGNLLIVLRNPQHVLKTFSILLKVECLLQIGRVYEWLLLPCRMFGGFASYVHVNRSGRLDIRLLGSRVGLVLDLG